MDIDTDTHIGRMLCEDGVPLQAKERDGMPANHQRLGRGKGGFLYIFQQQHGPTDALILDFWPPELKDSNVLLF